MGTLDIIRRVLFHIQGESNPIYKAEIHTTAAMRSRRIIRDSAARSGGCVALAMLGLLACLTAWGTSQRLFFREWIFGTIVIVGGGLFSAGWTVPLAAFAGQGISRERTAQTWDLLLTTPYDTETVLLAKASANINGVWRGALSLAFIVSLTGAAVTMALLLGTVAGKRISPLLGVVFLIIALVGIVIEREQEIALSVTVGIGTAFLADSPRLAMVFGVIGGLIIRLVQSLVTVILLSRLAPQYTPNLGLLNATAGSATLLVASPGVVALLVVGVFAILREMAVRSLFAWTMRRTREE